MRRHSRWQTTLHSDRGMGKAAASVKDEDFVEHLLIANTHDTLLCFNVGKVYWIKVYQIPVASGPQGESLWLTCCL